MQRIAISRGYLHLADFPGDTIAEFANAHPMIRIVKNFDASRPRLWPFWMSGRLRPGRKFRDRKTLFRLKIEKIKKKLRF